VDGTPLRYYGNWQTALNVVTTAGLISSGDGSCHAWSKLFVDVLRADGLNLTYQQDGRTIVSAVQDIWFLVKSWQFASQNVPAG